MMVAKILKTVAIVALFVCVGTPLQLHAEKRFLETGNGEVADIIVQARERGVPEEIINEALEKVAAEVVIPCICVNPDVVFWVAVLGALVGTGLAITAVRCADLCAKIITSQGRDTNH